MEPLKRIAYTDPPITGSTRTGSTARAESLVDQEDYFERLHRAHGAGFHGWGVGDGLQVAAEIGAADLRVKPGAALDAQGRLIVLAADGWAVIDPNADPNVVENIDTVTVTAQGVVLPTADLASGTYRVTIQFRETYSTGASGNLHHLLHTPWLLMQPVASLPPDDGSVLVLAEVSIDDSANVSALSAGQRRLAGLPAGSLALRRPASTSDAALTSVDQAGAAVLSVRADGGLDISTSQPGSPETMVPRLSIDGAGNVEIGPDGNQANLYVSGDLQLDGDAELAKNLTVAGDTDLGGKLTVAGDADLTGTLTVKDVAVTGKVDGRDVSVDGSMLDAHVADLNAHNLAVRLTGYLPLVGGAMSGDLTVTNIVVTGKVDDRDVSVDGSKLDTHLVDTSTTAHGIATHLAKYLPLIGGTLSGNLGVTGGKLHVADGTSALRFASESGMAVLRVENSAAASLSVLNLANNARAWQLRVDGGDSNKFHIYDATRVAYDFTIDTSGNVGIGTTSPGAKLEVVGGGGGNVDLRVNGRLRSDNNDGGLWIASDRFVGGHSTNQIGFWNGNAWRLSVQPNGNVGIGTTSPSVKLEINDGDLLFKAKAGGEDAGDIIFQNAGGTQKGRIWSNPSTGGGLNLSSGDNTPDIVIDATGRVGIGTTTLGDKLNVAGIVRILADSNPIRFTSGWTGFPDNVTNQAEISNDTSGHKTLMIVGNRSAGLGRRVSVWDRLEVNGILHAAGNGGVLNIEGADHAYIQWYPKRLAAGRKAWMGYGGVGTDTFTIRNDAGKVVIDGDVIITGRLGTAGKPESPIDPNWGGGIRTWDIEAEGSILTSHDLWVGGVARKPGGGSWTHWSDIGLKKNVDSLDHALERLLQLRGVSFEWKDPACHGNLTGAQMGMVAQDVEKVFPQWVSEDAGGIKMLTFRGFEALSVEAFRELNEMIEALGRRVGALEAR